MRPINIYHNKEKGAAYGRLREFQTPEETFRNCAVLNRIQEGMVNMKYNRKIVKSK